MKIGEIEWALHTFLALSYSRYCLWEDMDRPNVKQKVIKKYALHGIWVELGIWRIATFVSSSLKTKKKNGILLIKKVKTYFDKIKSVKLVKTSFSERRSEIHFVRQLVINRGLNFTMMARQGCHLMHISLFAALKPLTTRLRKKRIRVSLQQSNK